MESYPDRGSEPPSLTERLRAARDARPDPALELRRPLKVGALVEVNRGTDKGARGIVVEVVCHPSDPRHALGSCLYGVRLPCPAWCRCAAGEATHDIPRFMLVELSQRRLTDREIAARDDARRAR